MKDIKARVMAVNDELVKEGYSWPAIAEFWKECMNEAKGERVDRVLNGKYGEAES